jgi:hypothetical protein
MALIDPTSGRRFATARGIAFEAKPTADGTWHGYPIPWQSVPDWITRQWVEQLKVKQREIKKHFSYDRKTIHWALLADEQ